MNPDKRTPFSPLSQAIAQNRSSQSATPKKRLPVEPNSSYGSDEDFLFQYANVSSNSVLRSSSISSDPTVRQYMTLSSPNFKWKNTSKRAMERHIDPKHFVCAGNSFFSFSFAGYPL